VPLAPELIVSQLALLVAVQPHPATVVTVAVPVAPAPGGVQVVGETLNVQLPCCVTVTVWPATVRVPVRGEVEGFVV
jgi:hypothetical protein